MALSLVPALVPYAVGVLLALVLFVLLRRTGRLSPEFSSVAAALMVGPIFVAVFDIVGTSIVAFISADPERPPITLAMLAATAGFFFVTFAPTVVVLVPLVTFYVVRGLRKERLLSAVLVSAVSLGCMAVQIVWLSILANAID
jgi:hypothetical protein